MSKESGIYLIYLGTYKNLKMKFNITDSPLTKYRSFNNEDGIYKFGKTKNLKDRLNQHKNYYEKIIGGRGVYENFKLVCFKSIECDKLTYFENEIKNYCLDKNFHFIDESLSHTKHNELVIIKNSDVDDVINFYNSL